MAAAPRKVVSIRKTAKGAAGALGFTPAFGRRLEELIQKAGGQTQAADLVGVTDEQVYRWKTGAAKMPLYAAARLTSQAGRSVDWLLTGIEGPPGLALVALHDIRVSAGSGTWPGDEQPVDRIPFSEDWLRHSIGVEPARLVLVYAAGDSMAPTIDDGDQLLVEHGIHGPFADGIYVIRDSDRIQVKRIGWPGAGRVTIISDNPLYRPTELVGAAAEEVVVCGRVRWIGRVLR